MFLRSLAIRGLVCYPVPMTNFNAGTPGSDDSAEQHVLDEAQRIQARYGLHDWTFVIVDEHPTIEQAAGFTYFDTKCVEVYRELWPTHLSNMIEVTRHELAHAILGQGAHSVEWWEKLMELGGTGAWLDDEGEPAPWSWTLEKTMVSGRIED